MKTPPDAATAGLKHWIDQIERDTLASRGPPLSTNACVISVADIKRLCDLARKTLASHPREPWFSEEDREKIHAIQTLFSEYHFDGPLKHARDIGHLGMCVIHEKSAGCGPIQVAENVNPDLAALFCRLVNDAPALLRAVTAPRETEWRDIASAPIDRMILVWAPERDGLPALISVCRWHEDAGFCIDEIRDPEKWRELPPAPQPPGEPA